MGTPVIVSTPQDEWTLVASAVRRGIINQVQTGALYYQTYRCAGDTAPLPPDRTKVPAEAMRIFDGCTQAIIDSSGDIDVYIFCDVRDGQVRVDV